MWGTVITMMHTNAYCAAKQNGGNMFKTKEEARAFLRKVMGPPHRTLEGEEFNHVRLILALLEPYKQTNNQHTWTDYYKVGDIEYHVTNWPNGFEPTIDEYLPE
jgi:hypothetical protein